MTLTKVIVNLVILIIYKWTKNLRIWSGCTIYLHEALHDLSFVLYCAQLLPIIFSKYILSKCLLNALERVAVILVRWFLYCLNFFFYSSMCIYEKFFYLWTSFYMAAFLTKTAAIKVLALSLLFNYVTSFISFFAISAHAWQIKLSFYIRIAAGGTPYDWFCRGVRFVIIFYDYFLEVNY